MKLTIKHFKEIVGNNLTNLSPKEEAFQQEVDNRIKWWQLWRDRK